MSQNIFDIKNSINGDSVIAFTSTKTLKNMNFMDASKVSAHLMDDGDGMSHRKHLGMIQLFETTHKVQLPFMKDLFKGAQVLEVAEGQSVTYDLPVIREESRCVTAEDTSTISEAPGIDGSVFTIILNEEFTKGDILTYDPTYGEQIIVSEDHDVEMVGENYRHYVTLSTNDKRKFYPKEKLTAGIRYMKIGHVMAEYSTAYSGINMIKNPTGSLTNEFWLGTPRGVSTFMTRAAANMKAPGLKAFSDGMMDRVNQQLDALGGDKSNMFVVGRRVGNDIDKSTAKIGTTLEYLALMELAMMEAHSLLFAKAATIPTSNGVKRVTEGVWHQMRRGKLIKYSRTGGITINHLQEAGSYIFKNSTIPMNQRRLKFKGGFFAHQNVLRIIRENAVNQAQGLPGLMIGQDQQLPNKVFSGALDDLKMAYVAITEAYLPGVGYVSVEHDPSLDYQPLSDRFSQGAYGNQMGAHTSHSLVIWDATNSEYSNVTDKVKNAKLVSDPMAMNNNRANVYYVKPEGEPAVTYGYEQGRMANGSQFENVVSSMKHMGREFWAFSQSGALVLDTTRYIVIELNSPR